MCAASIFHAANTEKRRVILLDGGLGTTLEAHNIRVKDSPLWSSLMVKQNPGALLRTHNDFLLAGADIILTATYQATDEAFKRAGYNAEEAVMLMRRAVSLARESVTRFVSSDTSSRAPYVGLSLGPYGAQITQEFGGRYPLPFGPCSSDGTSTSNAFSSKEDDEKGEVALAEFHFRRLKTFASDPQCCEKVDVIAFETIPLLREGRAIRRAMTRFEGLFSHRVPPYWVSFVFPDGQCPEEVKTGDFRVSAADIARNMMMPCTGNGQQLSSPTAIGINCTKIEYLPAILRGFTEGLSEASPPSRPWLVLYPDGGQEFDVITKTWAADGKVSSETWAMAVAKISRDALMTKSEGGEMIWAGAIVGGCCKTGPEEINALRTACAGMGLI